MNQLVPCPACQRHVRVAERACPFCAASLDFSQLSPPVVPSQRLSRAASFAFGATLLCAAAPGACTSDDDNPADASVDGSTGGMYGGPPPGSGRGGAGVSGRAGHSGSSGGMSGGQPLSGRGGAGASGGRADAGLDAGADDAGD